MFLLDWCVSIYVEWITEMSQILVIYENNWTDIEEHPEMFLKIIIFYLANSPDDYN